MGASVVNIVCRLVSWDLGAKTRVCQRKPASFISACGFNIFGLGVGDFCVVFCVRRFYVSWRLWWLKFRVLCVSSSCLRDVDIPSVWGS